MVGGSMGAAKQTSIHGQWSSKWVFVLAATGSAVGLGNIWKFPYITGENGGGAFVLVYLLCIVAIGLPIMMAEIMLGRHGRQSPINTMRLLAEKAKAHPAWQYLGWMGVLAGFLILSYYSVIAGWALSYVMKSISGAFVAASAADVEDIFSQLTGSPVKLLFWHSLFILMTMAVVARGVRGGLEKAVRFLMPALFAILLVLVGYAMTTGEYFFQGITFLFAPDFSRLTGAGVLIAMGHAFFTLSLGMGAIMVYGSYMPQNASITATSLAIVGADTVVALLAGMAIFPIVFANGLAPGAGPGLIFQTLPVAFGQMPGGIFFASLFFLLLVFAAWTSAISLIEPAVAWLVENHGMSRLRASVWAGLVTWLVGLGTVFSFNLASDWTLFGKTFFDLLDFLTANIMLPLGGLLIAVFCGWVFFAGESVAELATRPWLYSSWRFLLRYISPAAVVVVFLQAIGVLG